MSLPGIRKIADSCREAGLDEPTYSDGKGFVSVCFTRLSYGVSKLVPKPIPKLQLSLVRYYS